MAAGRERESLPVFLLSREYVKMLIGIVGAIVGGVITVIVQRCLFSEKLKEIVYKERLAAVKELTELLGKLEILIVNAGQQKAELDKLIDETVNFRLLVNSKRLFISSEALELFKDIGTLFGEAITKPAMVKVKILRVKHKEAALFALLRKEFGIDPLTEQTEWSIKTSPQNIADATHYFYTPLKRLWPKRKSEKNTESTV